MVSEVATFYQDSSEVVALKALRPVVRVESELASYLELVEVSRTLKEGLGRATFEVVDRIETLKRFVQPNRKVVVSQVLQADAVSLACFEWELFRGVMSEGTAEVSGKTEGVAVFAENTWDVASRFGRRVHLSLQSAGEVLDVGQSNVVEAELDSLLDEAGRHDFSGSVVLPWIHPDIWPGDVVESIDGRKLDFGKERLIEKVTLRFGDEWTTTLGFGGGV